LKIVKLEAENYKRLKAIEIIPEGNTVVISGKNGAGKTSVLDAIWACLSGGDAGRKIKKPVRNGEENAKIVLELDELIVTRTWTGDDKTYLTVESKDGAAYKSPQAILDALVGRLTFDPLEFAGLKSKEQVAALLDVVDIGVDPAALEVERGEFYDERAIVNREVKRLEGVLASTTTPYKDAPTEEVSATSLVAKLEDAKDVHRKRDDIASDLERQVNESKRITAAVINLKEEFDREKKELEKSFTEKEGQLQNDLENNDHNVMVTGKELEEISNVLPDIEEIQKEVNDADETNANARAAKAWHEVTKQLKTKQEESKALTDKILAIDKEKSDAIKVAQMPVEGLSFDENGLTFNGVPFAQASSAEQLRISTAMAMAANPKLRVIRVTDGSLLDSDSMKMIEQLAKDNDYQIWIEVVDDSGKMGVYIEDGAVAERPEAT